MWLWIYLDKVFTIDRLRALDSLNNSISEARQGVGYTKAILIQFDSTQCDQILAHKVSRNQPIHQNLSVLWPSNYATFNITQLVMCVLRNHMLELSGISCETW